MRRHFCRARWGSHLGDLIEDTNAILPIDAAGVPIATGSWRLLRLPRRSRALLSARRIATDFAAAPNCSTVSAYSPVIDEKVEPHTK